MTIKNHHIIAVDFDGTLSTGTWNKDPNKCTYNMNKPLIDALNEFRSKILDGKIILWTCRGGVYLKQAVLKCKEYGLTFDAINCNVPGVYEWFDDYSSPKIYADFYIDDRALITDNHPIVFANMVYSFIKKCLSEATKE